MTTYEWKDGGWNSQQPSIGAMHLTQKKPNETTVDCKKNPTNIKIQEISSKNQYLQIKFENEPWYTAEGSSDSKASRVINEGDPSQEELSEIWKKQKYGSWIWVEDKGSQWKILGGLDFSFKKTKNSEQSQWMLTGCSQTYFLGSKELTWSSFSKLKKAQDQTINGFPKGKWIDTQEFCNYGYKRKVDEDKLKKLKLFCAKPITNP